MKKTNQNQWDLIVKSPGRINLIGEHVDYNNGFVLPTAIDKTITFKFRKTPGSNDFSIFSNYLNKGLTASLKRVSISKHIWENYLLGVIHELQQLNCQLQGFVCEFDSNIPVGSGISSSAALECGLAFGLNELFGLGLDKLNLVKLSQRAEHNFVGTLCGIMDQFASVMSKAGNFILLDCETLEFDYIPANLTPYTLLLLNTNVKHDLSSGEYNIRRSQCEQGVEVIRKKHPQVKSLRNASIIMVEESGKAMGVTVYKRCKYVVEEIARVHAATAALKANNLAELGEYLYESHEGLSKGYEVSCPELDFLVDFSRKHEEVLGARMMGGGFGGCTINLIKASKVDFFVEEVSLAYRNKFGIDLTAFEARPGGGTCIAGKNYT